MADSAVVAADLPKAIADHERAGYRLDLIRPADEPRLAEMSHPHKGAVLITSSAPPTQRPEVKRGLTITRTHDAAPGEGRASMVYRDLAPDRLGGALIASHISIPDGGPVPDSVHHHDIGFQVICCVRGWVDVVYQDQGPPFRMAAGDCVLQPPGIRHRVLHASVGLEVVEVCSPAEHDTRLDHSLDLPTPEIARERDFGGQQFTRGRGGEGRRVDLGGGLVAETTDVADASGGAGSVETVTANASAPGAIPVSLQRADSAVIGYVVAGSVAVGSGDDETARLTVGDAVIGPPGVDLTISQPSPDLELLAVRVAVTNAM